jgi:hypothetical protein
MMLLQALGQLLCRWHGVEAIPSIEQFLIKDASLMGRTWDIGESVFIIEEEQSLYLGLYFDEAVLAFLRDDSPFGMRGLHPDNLQAFLHTAEGVSHFFWVYNRQKWQRPISCLELEILAEIDKFLLCWWFFLRQGMRSREHWRWLWRALFVDVVFTGQVAEHYGERYRVANRVAQRFLSCAGLCRQGHLTWGDLQRVRFYAELPLALKIRSGF